MLVETAVEVVTVPVGGVLVPVGGASDGGHLPGHYETGRVSTVRHTPLPYTRIPYTGADNGRPRVPHTDTNGDNPSTCIVDGGARSATYWECVTVA